MRIRLAITLLVLTFTSVIDAEDSTKVAVIEFQNDAGTIITTNRWTMADDVGKRLRKKNKNVQLISRKDILKQLKELSWNDGRLVPEQEGRLTELGAKYVIYGSIVHWGTSGIYSDPQVQDAVEANVIFAINVIDLTTGNSVKSFTVDGRSTGETGFIRDGDPAAFEDDTDSQELYDATEVATIKAGDILAGVITK